MITFFLLFIVKVVENLVSLRFAREGGCCVWDTKYYCTAVHWRDAQCIWFHSAGCSLSQSDANISANSCSPPANTLPHLPPPPNAAGVKKRWQLLPVIDSKETAGCERWERWEARGRKCRKRRKRVKAMEREEGEGVKEGKKTEGKHFFCLPSLIMRRVKRKTEWQKDQGSRRGQQLVQKRGWQKLKSES